MRLLSRLAALTMVAFLAQGCSWFADDEEVEPAQLESFKAEMKIDTDWSASSGGSLGETYHSLRPAFLSTRVFLVDANGDLTAIDKDTGKSVWKQPLGVTIIGGVGAGDGKVMVTTTDGRLLVHSALDGSELWQANLKAEAVAPAQANAQVVVAQTIDGRLSAFKSSDGSPLWTYKADLPALTLRGTSTPVLLENALFAGFSNGKLVAIDPASGRVAWDTRIALPQGKTELERVVDIDGELLLDAGIIYITSYQGRLMAISASNARTLWTKDFSSFRGLADAGTQLIAVDAEGNVVAFDKRNGLELWRQEGLFYRQPTNPAFVSGGIALADYQGYLHILSPEDGRFVARKQIDSNGVNGPLMVVDNHLYVYGNSGRLTVVSLK